MPGCTGAVRQSPAALRRPPALMNSMHGMSRQKDTCGRRGRAGGAHVARGCTTARTAAAHRLAELCAPAPAWRRRPARMRAAQAAGAQAQRAAAPTHLAEHGRGARGNVFRMDEPAHQRADQGQLEGGAHGGAQHVRVDAQAQQGAQRGRVLPGRRRACGRRRRAECRRRRSGQGLQRGQGHAGDGDRRHPDGQGPRGPPGGAQGAGFGVNTKPQTSAARASRQQSRRHWIAWGCRAPASAASLHRCPRDAQSVSVLAVSAAWARVDAVGHWRKRGRAAGRQPGGRCPRCGGGAAAACPQCRQPADSQPGTDCLANVITHQGQRINSREHHDMQVQQTTGHAQKENGLQAAAAR